MTATILRNDKIRRIESFHPGTDAERELLCNIYKVNTPQSVDLSSSRDSGYRDAVDNLHTLFNDDSIIKLRTAIRSAGFHVKQSGDSWFAIDFSSKTIVNLSEEGFDTRKLEYRKFKRKPVRQNEKKTHGKTGNGIRGIHDAASGRGENREWEVGYRGDYNRIDDENSIKI